MTAGLSVAVANAALGTITGTDMAYAGLNTADPGTAGTTGTSTVTTREAVTWGSASAGVITSSDTQTWSSWAGTNGEVEEYITLWSLATSGAFGASVPLSANVTMDTGDTLEVTAISITVPTAT